MEQLVRPAARSMITARDPAAAGLTSRCAQILNSHRAGVLRGPLRDGSAPALVRSSVVKL